MANYLIQPATSGLSRQRSTCFLLDPPRVQGSDFVEMLRLIGYPGAHDLKGEDFDWLCEGNEETELFLGWLCGVVDQHNSLSNEQLEAYNALVDSGQPLLDADELQNLCKGGSEGEEEWELNDERSLEDLEAELQSLRALRTHRLQSRNKTESLGLTLHCNRLSLEKWEKELEKNLCHIKEDVSTLNSKCNSALLRLQEMVTELGEYHSAQPAPNTFLSSLDLKGYLRLEDTCWEQAEENAKVVFTVKEEDLDQEIKTQELMEKECERVRMVWASQKIQLGIALSTLNGNKEALTWLERHAGDQMWDTRRLPLLEREVQSMETEVDGLQNQKLPALVCEASIGLCLPALQEWMSTEKQRLARLDQNQEPVVEAVLHQLSRLQLVELGLQAEKREHGCTERELHALVAEMTKRSGELGKRMLGPRDLRGSSQWLTPLRVDSKDQTAVRLSAMFENPSRQKELFPKYEALQRQAAAIVQELMSLDDVCNGSLPQTPRLECDCEELHQSLCRGTRNLQLRDPNLTLSFETLSSCVSQFNQWCLDCLRDLERKKISIHTSYREQERQLYLLFYQDPAHLANIIQDIEQRVRDLCLD